jgi:hypothetical protein
MGESEIPSKAVFDAESVVSDLIRLRQDITEMRHSYGELTAAYGAGDPTRASAALLSVRRVLDSEAALVVQLKRNVLPFDRHGSLGSLDELVLRAVAIVVEAQVQRLSDAFDGAAAHTCATQLLIERFRKLAAFLRYQMHRANAGWLLHRRVHEQSTLPRPARERAAVLYREAIREGQNVMDHIRRYADLVHFLRAGAACTEWPEVYAPCTLIAAALDIPSSTDELADQLASRHPRPARSCRSGSHGIANLPLWPKYNPC